MTKKKVHILGICGTFMGGIALLAKEKGIEVSGCDANVYPPMSDHLRDMGIEIIEGYEVSNLPDADQFIIGNSISRGNPAIEHLLSSGEKIISGPDWLNKNILSDKKVIAVSGTHGKTTTTAMISWILEDQGIDAGYLIAGKPKNFEKSARYGKDDIFVIEADEYDTAFFDKRSKFIHYYPETLIINNLEFDHGDIFPDLTYIFKEFHNLVRVLSSEAKIIFPSDDENIRHVLEMGCWSKLISYDLEGKNENTVSIKEGHENLTYKIKDDEGDLDWAFLGVHNARNAMSASLAVHQYGISLDSSLKSLRNFQGVAKRQDTLLDSEELILIEDFAHHPTAIRSTIEGVRKRYPQNRLMVAIELRSNTMKSGFHDSNLIKSVVEADKVFWKGENKSQIEGLINNNPINSSQIIDIDKFVGDFRSTSSAGDILLVMSNGDFSDLSNKVIKSFENE